MPSASRRASRAPEGFRFPRSPSPTSLRRWLVTAALGGADRLGLHNYQARFDYDAVGPSTNIAVGYANFQLAPWLLSTNVARSTAGPTLDWSASVAASRELWLNPLKLSFEALDRRVTADATHLADHVRL